MSTIIIGIIMLMVASLLTTLSFQRSGAVVNATLDEYQNIMHHRVHSGEMMQVVHHKTGVSASAKVVLTQAYFSKVNTYVCHIYTSSARPIQSLP